MECTLNQATYSRILHINKGQFDILHGNSDFFCFPPRNFIIFVERYIYRQQLHLCKSEVQHRPNSYLSTDLGARQFFGAVKHHTTTHMINTIFQLYIQKLLPVVKPLISHQEVDSWLVFTLLLTWSSPFIAHLNSRIFAFKGHDLHIQYM